jgi:uracil-DNA glycosylase family 4
VDRDQVARSLAAHLAGLSTWGIDLVRGAPAAPVAAGSAVGNAVGSDPAAALATIAEEIAACTRCGLCESRTNTVPGVGDPRATLLFVGEAPGHDEDLRGEPFVGRAGQLLDKIIAALGFRREQVHILNILKCRPPNNRDPSPDETAACTPFLERQIDSIAPQQIVALGRPAARFLTGRDLSIARLRGGRHEYRGIPVVVTYHPAYLLRNPSAKAQCWQDLQPVVRGGPSATTGRR